MTYRDPETISRALPKLNVSADELQAALVESIRAQGLEPEEVKQLLRRLVAETWPDLPIYSTLKKAEIMEVPTAMVGANVVPVFNDNGTYKVVVARVGNHYAGTRYLHQGHHDPKYMAVGGFMNLMLPGGTPKIAAMREWGEEIVDENGKPLIPLEENRLRQLSIKNAPATGHSLIVVRHVVELTREEFDKLQAHITRMETDPDYHRRVREATKNPKSGEPEVCAPAIIPLAEMVADPELYPLLNPNQHQLFSEIQERLSAGPHVARLLLRPNSPYLEK